MITARQQTTSPCALTIGEVSRLPSGLFYLVCFAYVDLVTIYLRLVKSKPIKQVVSRVVTLPPPETTVDIYG